MADASIWKVFNAEQNKEFKMDVESDVSSLVTCTDEDFDAAIAKLDIRGLISLVSRLQNEMATEQKRFDELSQRLENGRLNNSAHQYTTAALCASQARLALLCARNMKCFTQQAVKAKQEQASVLGSRSSSTRESEAAKCHRNGFRDNLLFFELQSKMSNGSHANASSKSTRTSLSTQYRRSLTMPSSLSCSSPNLSDGNDDDSLAVNGNADVTSGSGPFTIVCRVGKDTSEAPKLNGFHSLPRSHTRCHDDGELDRGTNAADSVRFHASTLPLSRRVRSLGDGLDDEGTRSSARVHRAPSVEEILQNVKDLRMRQTDASSVGTTGGILKHNPDACDLSSSRDSPMYENVTPRKLDPIYQNVPAEDPIYQNIRGEEPLYDVPRKLDTPLRVLSPNLPSLKSDSVVPTATQLILQARMKGGETNNNNNGYDGDDVLSDCDRDSLEDEGQLPPQIPSPDYGSDEDDAAYGVYEDYMNDYPDSGLGESEGRSAYYLEDQALEVIVEEEEEDLEDEDYNSGRSDDKGSSLEYSSLGLSTTKGFHNNDINKDDISSDDSIYQKGSNGESKRQDVRNHVRHSSAASCPDKFDLPDSAVDIDDLSSIDGPLTSPDPTDGSQLLSPEEGVYSDNNLTASPEGSQEMESSSRCMSPGLQAFQNDERAVMQSMMEEKMNKQTINGDHHRQLNYNQSFQNGRHFSNDYRTVEKSSNINSNIDLDKVTTNKPELESYEPYRKRREEDASEVVKHALPSVKALRNQFEVNQNGNNVSASPFPRNVGTMPVRRTKKLPDRTSSWNGQDVSNGNTTKMDKSENVSQTLPIRRSRSIVSQSDKSIPELIHSLGGDRIISNTLPKTSHTKAKSYCDTMNGAIRTAKPIFSPEPPTSPDDVIPSIIAQFGNVVEVGDYSRSSSSQHQWDPTLLLKKLYEVQSPQPTYSADVTSTFINIEGYLDKLPSGRKKATFWNAWKRRFFRIKDGYLYYYQSSTTDKPSLTLNLMGGHIDSMDTTMLGIDDGKGHYVVIRCSNRQEMEQWRTALQTHTVENFNLTYTQPVPAYPHFYEDVIIIDLGSCSVRAGILCNQPTLPLLFFPSVCSIQRETGRHTYGIEALTPSNRANANVVFPLRPSAKITKYSVDLEAVAGILMKVFTDLNVDPKKYQIQLSLPRSFTVRTQTEVLRLLFDQFGVKSVNLTTQTVLSLLSYNATSGIVVDIGERMDVIPIIDGYVVEPGVSRIPYGGARIIDHLRHFLLQRHYNLVSDIDSYLVRYVLEQMCYCAEKYNDELQKFFTDPESIEMSLSIKEFFSDPPWDEITLDNGRFQAPEGLFNPDAWGLDNPGIHKLVHKAVQECSLDIRKEMTRSIYLSGGLTLLPGFAARLETEVNKLTPPSLTPKVHGSPYRYHAAYLGACILAGSPGFQEAKITANDWFQNGVNCLRKWHL